MRDRAFAFINSTNLTGFKKSSRNSRRRFNIPNSSDNFLNNLYQKTNKTSNMFLETIVLVIFYLDKTDAFI